MGAEKTVAQALFNLANKAVVFKVQPPKQRRHHGLIDAVMSFLRERDLELVQ
jgi:hypothetical protein